MAKQPRGAELGLRGQDKQQEALRGPNGGAAEPPREGGTAHRSVKERRTPSEAEQPGADVRPNPDIVPDVNLPEGLRRPRQPPYDRDRGRE
jgi:hypothetical protein